MPDIHCHTCGGFMSDTWRISYQPPSGTTFMASPHSGLCTCATPIVYGPPPGHLSSPGMPGVGSRTT